MGNLCGRPEHPTAYSTTSSKQAQAASAALKTQQLQQVPSTAPSLAQQQPSLKATSTPQQQQQQQAPSSTYQNGAAVAHSGSEQQQARAAPSLGTQQQQQQLDALSAHLPRYPATITTPDAISATLSAASRELESGSVVRPGSSFEDAFELAKVIGHGAFAKVSTCTRRSTGEEFAVKAVIKNPEDTSGKQREGECVLCGGS